MVFCMRLNHTQQDVKASSIHSLVRHFVNRFAYLIAAFAGVSLIYLASVQQPSLHPTSSLFCAPFLLHWCKGAITVRIPGLMLAA